jgi:hypothetical protein
VSFAGENGAFTRRFFSGARNGQYAGRPADAVFFAAATDVDSRQRLQSGPWTLSFSSKR